MWASFIFIESYLAIVIFQSRSKLFDIQFYQIPTKNENIRSNPSLINSNRTDSEFPKVPSFSSMPNNLLANGNGQYESMENSGEGHFLSFCPSLTLLLWKESSSKNSSMCRLWIVLRAENKFSCLHFAEIFTIGQNFLLLPGST